MAMSGTKKALLIIGGIFAVVVFVVLLGVAMIVAAFRKSEPTIRDNSVLLAHCLTTPPTILSRGSLVVQISR